MIPGTKKLNTVTNSPLRAGNFLLGLLLFLVYSTTGFSQDSGELDLSFGNNGISTLDVGMIDHCEVMTTDANGNIYFGGSALQVGTITRQEYFIGRLTPNGALDTSFGNNGLLKGEFAPGLLSRISDLKLSDQHLFFMGETSDLLRPDTQQVFIGKVDLDGNWDLTFGVNGLCTDPFLSGSAKAGSLEILSNGKLLWCGMTLDTLPWHLELPLIVRLNPDGSRDSIFGGTGALTWSNTDGLVPLAQRTAAHSEGGRFSTILVEPDGYLIAGAMYSASFSTGFLMRIDTLGMPDPGFGTNGVLYINLPSTLSTAFTKIRYWKNKYLLSGPLLNFNGNEDFFLACVDSSGAAAEIAGVDFAGLEDRAFDLEVDQFGQILLVGQSVDPANGMLGSQSDQVSFAALNGIHNLAIGFGQAGKFSWSPASGEDAGGTSMSLNSDGKIVLGGYIVDTLGGNFSDLIFMQIGNDGTTDTEQATIGNPRGSRNYIYPNPATERIFVKEIFKDPTGDVVDLSGKLILRQVPLRGGIEVSDLAPGAYYLKMRNGSLRFVKQ